MSLDVYLEINEEVQHDAKIYVREEGTIRELTRQEWDEKFPGQEPVIMQEHADQEVFSANITHNLSKMASEAGIYQPLWRPEELEITLASQLIAPLEQGLELLESDPARFKPFNPENGWGTYGGLIDFVSSYLLACREWPNAKVSISR